MMALKFSIDLSRIMRFAEKWRWLILLLLGLSLLWMEIKEFQVLRVWNQPFHFFEVFQYAVLLICTGTLIELYSRSNKAHQRALQILEYKHNLSMEFTSNEDWDLLTAKLTKLPGTIADVEESYLILENPINGRFEIVSRREQSGHSINTQQWDPTIPCPTCFENIFGKKINFHRCRNNTLPTTHVAYSLGMIDPDLNMTVLKFRLTPGQELSDEDKELFINIGDEIAVALRASRNRKRVADLQSAQVAMAERRMMSAYVHDQLGQNLGYLHLKLDQLGKDTHIRKSRELHRVLDQLRSVANESYEIVRDMLKKIHPDTIPHLTNFLKEHARKISHRTGFSLDFRSAGRQTTLLPDSQQLILFLFYEIFNNIEKHARAERVSVFIVWRKSTLNLSIMDDGIGFDSTEPRVNNQYGLQMLHERIAKLNGCLTIDSSGSAGTTVSISMPLRNIKDNST